MLICSLGRSLTHSQAHGKGSDEMLRQQDFVNHRLAMVKKNLMLRHLMIDFPTSLAVNARTSEQMSAEERTTKASNMKQANEWAVRAKEQTDKRAAQYLQGDSFLFWTIVRWDGRSAIKRPLGVQSVVLLTSFDFLLPYSEKYIQNDNEAEKSDKGAFHPRHFSLCFKMETLCEERCSSTA